MKAGFLSLIEATLDEVLPRPDARPAVLHEAMRYAVGTGGKRIRPLVCLGAAVAAGGRYEDARYPAAAIEILHNYTLIHDDLPAMDDDVERRGQPTVWKKFGEANAILAGDALLALAYRVAARAPRNVAAIVDVLGEKGVGVVQGQVEDIALQGLAAAAQTTHTAQTPEHPNTQTPSQTIPFVYEHKTADLFVAAAAMGGLSAGADAKAVDALKTFALNLGLAFQYEDDLLDGDSPYPREDTERLVRETTAAATAALESLPGDASFLRALAETLVGRRV